MGTYLSHKGPWRLVDCPTQLTLYDLDLSVVFHDKYQWEIWKNTAGISATERHTLIGHMHFVWIFIYFDKYIGICNAHLFSIDALRTWNMMYDHMFQLFNNRLVSWIVSWYLWGWWSSMGGSRVVHGVTEAGPWGVLLLVSCAYISLNKAWLGLVNILQNLWQEKN